MRRFYNTIALAVALIAFPIASVTYTGCTTTQQRIAYNSLFTTGLAVNSAYAGWNDAVVKGTATFSVNVAKAYADFQSVYNVAVVAAQANLQAIAPQNVVDAANAVYAAIQQFTKK